MDFRESSKWAWEYLEGLGYAPIGGEVWDSSDHASWRNRTGVMLQALFPIEGAVSELEAWQAGAPWAFAGTTLLGDQDKRAPIWLDSRSMSNRIGCVATTSLGRAVVVVSVACVTWIALAPVASAQGPQTSFQSSSEAPTVQGEGWDSLRDPRELVSFGLDLLTAGVLAGLLIFHPVEVRRRRTVRDFDGPRLLFLYAVIGLAIGFLVVHHGYVIGFILFGIGGLLRFKTDLGDTVDTTLAIVVTLIGLCAGLNLPVMAVAVCLSAWAILYLFARSTHYTLEVKFHGSEALREWSERLALAFSEKGWKCSSVTKSHFKSNAQFILSVSQKLSREEVTREIEASLPNEDEGVAEWRLT